MSEVGKKDLMSEDVGRGRKKNIFGRVAQWQERLTHIQEVAGSIPAAPTSNIKASREWRSFLMPERQLFDSYQFFYFHLTAKILPSFSIAFFFRFSRT